MNIALIGYGKMGREVAQLASNKGHRIVAKCDPVDEEKTHSEISSEALQTAHVCLEFTQPQAVVENVRKVALLKKPLVVGTTGWYESLPQVRSLVSQAEIGFVFAPNFSIGVNLFYQIAEKAAQLFDHFEEYDVFGFEKHHRHKVDSPSGTAKRLSEIVLKNLTRKKKVTTESLSRAITPDEYHLVSIRGGECPGTHSLTFDSVADTIELIHTARSRASFALGALLAAEWIVNRKGFYTFAEVLAEIVAHRRA